MVNAHDGRLRLTGAQQDPDPPAECRQRCSARQRLASLFLLFAQSFTIAHACTFRHAPLR